MFFFGNKNRRFQFDGRHHLTGKMVKGEVQAKNHEEAKKKLARRGIHLIQLNKAKKISRRIKSSDIALFTRQLATMLKAGLPLLQAFEIVARGHHNPKLTSLLMNVRVDVEQGSSLSAAFAKYPQFFNRFYCNLVAAGEMGGVLDTLLDKLALYQEKNLFLRKQVKSALTYPIAVIVMAIAVVAVMMIYVLPTFERVYADIGATLPVFTQLVMNISAWLAHHYWWIAGITLLLGVLGWRAYHRVLAFRRRIDALLLRLPIVGNIVRKAVIARWSRTMATLFAAGVPLLDSLEAVAAASGNMLYEEATLHIRHQVNQGISLTSAMNESDLFGSMILQMVAIGEETGSLDDMLNKAAQFYEDDVDTAVAQLSSLMTPVIVLVLGGIIGVILVAMYLPLFRLGSVVA